MRSIRTVHAVDSHTEGMPTRVVVGGVETFPGETMAERRLWFIENADYLRKFLMFEPRGHSAMSGAILQPPTRPDADWGVLYIEVSGCLPMCGHGTIGVATVLVETGMVAVTEPTTEIRLDTPAGLVIASVEVSEGRALSVTLTNVPSFLLRKGATVSVPYLGQVEYDLGFGGNLYAIVDLEKLDIPFLEDRSNKQDLVDAGLAIMEAINEQDYPVHPAQQDISGCHHVYLRAPGSNAKRSRHAMVVSPGMFDRSPCGTGTSARMAQLHALGELSIGDKFINVSYIGSEFQGTLISETEVEGIPAVIPSFTGRAWLTGTAQYMLDPHDPFPEGFLI